MGTLNVISNILCINPNHIPIIIFQKKISESSIRKNMERLRLDLSNTFKSNFKIIFISQWNQTLNVISNDLCINLIIFLSSLSRKKSLKVPSKNMERLSPDWGLIYPIFLKQISKLSSSVNEIKCYFSCQLKYRSYFVAQYLLGYDVSKNTYSSIFDNFFLVFFQKVIIGLLMSNWLDNGASQEPRASRHLVPIVHYQK